MGEFGMLISTVIFNAYFLCCEMDCLTCGQQLQLSTPILGRKYQSVTPKVTSAANG
jgi:hypothetical protein